MRRLWRNRWGRWTTIVLGALIALSIIGAIVSPTEEPDEPAAAEAVEPAPLRPSRLRLRLRLRLHLPRRPPLRRRSRTADG